MLPDSKQKKKSFAQRHYEYDWLRIIAVAVIIFYHVGLIFVNTRPLINSDSWIISDSGANSKLLQAILIFLKQWSLSLLFLISGIGIKFALTRKTTSEVIEERCKRLLVPLFFGIIFLNPIQDFYDQNLISSDISLSVNNLLKLITDFNPSFHHLWFIAFLFIFSIVNLPFFNFIKMKNGDGLLINMHLILKNNFGIVILVLPLVIYEIYLNYFVPHVSIHEFNFNRIVYIIIFIYGFLFASIPTLRETLLSSRYKNLILGLVIAPVYYYTAKSFDSSASFSAFILISFLKDLCCFLWLFATIGFSMKYLSFTNNFLKYCNEAVYPFYILHQVILLIIGYEVIQWDINYLQKIAIIFIGTLIACFLLHQIIKKNAFLRIIFGLKMKVPSSKNIKKEIAVSPNA